MDRSLLECFNWTAAGYEPLVFGDGWQVALLNWDPSWANADEIERHNQTDEVFFLWRGCAMLFVSNSQGFQAEDLKPGIIYNVPRGVWHALMATPDASMLIVENRDTHLDDTEIRPMTSIERENLKAHLPGWADR